MSFSQYRSSSHSSLRWRHNDHDGVSNHQPHGCLLNRLFRRRSKKTSKLRVTGLCVGTSPGPVNSPHKWPVTRKMFPFDDVIMYKISSSQFSLTQWYRASYKYVYEYLLSLIKIEALELHWCLNKLLGSLNCLDNEWFMRQLWMPCRYYKTHLRTCLLGPYGMCTECALLGLLFPKCFLKSYNREIECISSALLTGWLSNLRDIVKAQTRNLRLRYVTGFCVKASVRLVNKGLQWTFIISIKNGGGVPNLTIFVWFARFM